MEKASVCNFFQTHLCKVLLQNLNAGNQKYDKNEEYDLTNFYGVSCSLMPIINNSEYSHKVEVARKERISITIR